ncbi:hypothetical protein BpHYR1_040736 [Brachionus plicatilis]|uniref:Uncharacterized protein n=1 Tax=Brachionus plicatilis TaxID=10195 RepID=A0A3M7RQY5_BRAPC|nr:hypothetical protein BpHYR1_040736 [Brachionus plicatilis]
MQNLKLRKNSAKYSAILCTLHTIKKYSNQVCTYFAEIDNKIYHLKKKIISEHNDNLIFLWNFLNLIK